jgi:hypothetical protein
MVQCVPLVSPPSTSGTSSKVPSRCGPCTVININGNTKISCLPGWRESKEATVTKPAFSHLLGNIIPVWFMAVSCSNSRHTIKLLPRAFVTRLYGPLRSAVRLSVRQLNFCWSSSAQSFLTPGLGIHDQDFCSFMYGSRMGFPCSSGRLRSV